MVKKRELLRPGLIKYESGLEKVLLILALFYQIFLEFKFKMLDYGDKVMADRGFDISDVLPDGVTLNIPPFKGSRSPLTTTETEETARIAAVRIHVERAIGRIKNDHILDGVRPSKIDFRDSVRYTKPKCGMRFLYFISFKKR